MRGIQLANTRCWLIYSNWRKKQQKYTLIPNTRVGKTNGLCEEIISGAGTQRTLNKVQCSGVNQV